MLEVSSPRRNCAHHRVGLFFFFFGCVACRVVDMPGKRSIAAWTGWRKERDEYYRTAHSKPGRKFIEVRSEEAVEIKKMSCSRAVHSDRECMNGWPSHLARSASIAANRGGHIDRITLEKDLKTHSYANAAKHSLGGVASRCPAVASSLRLTKCGSSGARFCWADLSYIDDDPPAEWNEESSMVAGSPTCGCDAVCQTDGPNTREVAVQCDDVCDVLDYLVNDGNSWDSPQWFPLPAAPWETFGAHWASFDSTKVASLEAQLAALSHKVETLECNVKDLAASLKGAVQESFLLHRPEVASSDTSGPAAVELVKEIVMMIPEKVAIYVQKQQLQMSASALSSALHDCLRANAMICTTCVRFGLVTWRMAG